MKISFFRFLNKAYDPGVERVLANKSDTQQNFSGNWKLQRGTKGTQPPTHRCACVRGEVRGAGPPCHPFTALWPGRPAWRCLHLQPRGPAVA